MTNSEVRYLAPLDHYYVDDEVKDLTLDHYYVDREEYSNSEGSSKGLNMKNSASTCKFKIPYCDGSTRGRLTKKLQQRHGINSIVYTRGSISISGEHLHLPAVQKTITKRYSSRIPPDDYVKLVSCTKKRNDAIQSDGATTKQTNTNLSEDGKALVSIEKNHNVEALGFKDTNLLDGNSSPKKVCVLRVEADINYDRDRKHASEINQQLLRIHGVESVITNAWEWDAASIRIYTDGDEDQVKIMETISDVWKKAKLVSCKLQKPKPTTIEQVPFWSRYKHLFSCLGKSI